MVMQFLIALAWICIAALAVYALPWAILGVGVVYFRLLRRGAEMAWFDWPALLAMAVAGGLINIMMLMIVAVFERITGISFLPPPQWGRAGPPTGTA